MKETRQIFESKAEHTAGVQKTDNGKNLNNDNIKNDNAKDGKSKSINTKDLEKNFGRLAPLARILDRATRVLENETKLVISRASLQELRSVALEKEALLNQHDVYLSRLGDLPALVATMDKRVRARLRHLYLGFEGALRRNGLRLSAALNASEALLSALSEAALADSPKSPQLYTPHARMSETNSVSVRERKEI